MTDDPTLGEIGRSLKRIELRLDKLTDDHEARLRRLERWMAAVPPALVLAAASFLTTVISR